jgi:NAD(P)-dependent dehydrogenase (short-subunit alcohol dehydrogenase family)
MPAAARAEVFDEQARVLPVGRVGQPDDVAHAARFLMENGFVTGSVIECDGGLHLL